MPNYSRSHLGRYVRKLFAVEIEKELRRLEEFVLDVAVDDDVGENLIAGVLGPQAEYSTFSPKPAPEGSASVSASVRAPDEGGFDLHGAETLILDSEGGRRGQPGDADRAGPAADENLHDAPTLIINPDRRARRGGGRE
jgi:hypothetical protein